MLQLLEDKMKLWTSIVVFIIGVVLLVIGVSRTISANTQNEIIPTTQSTDIIKMPTQPIDAEDDEFDDD